MQCLKQNPKYAFTEEETKKMEAFADVIVSLMKARKNLTYIEAEEVLRICEIKLEQSLLK